jgi:hypothetical protein
MWQLIPSDLHLDFITSPISLYWQRDALPSQISTARVGSVR